MSKIGVTLRIRDKLDFLDVDNNKELSVYSQWVTTEHVLQRWYKMCPSNQRFHHLRGAIQFSRIILPLEMSGHVLP